MLCTGKVYFDLLEAQHKAGHRDVALVRLEQLYPLPVQELHAVLGRYPEAAELTWVQEEPRNMGAWHFVREAVLDGLLDIGERTLRYVGRKPSAAPAPGSLKVHIAEQEDLVRQALEP